MCSLRHYTLGGAARPAAVAKRTPAARTLAARPAKQLTTAGEDTLLFARQVVIEDDGQKLVCCWLGEKAELSAEAFAAKVLEMQ